MVIVRGEAALALAFVVLPTTIARVAALRARDPSGTRYESAYRVILDQGAPCVGGSSGACNIGRPAPGAFPMQFSRCSDQS